MKTATDGNCTIKTLYIPGVVEAMQRAGFTTAAMLCAAKALYAAQGAPGGEVALGIKPRFRVEWMHNGNWRMDDPAVDFGTYPEAFKAVKKMKKQSSGELQTRIVEI